MFVDTITTIGAVCASFAAICGVVVGFWWFVRKVVKIAEAVEQLQPNGGKSLSDRVDSILLAVNDLSDRVSDLEKRE